MNSLTLEMPGPEWMLAASVAAVTLAVAILVKAGARWLLRNSAKTRSQVDDLLLALVQSTRVWLIALPALSGGTHASAMPVKAAGWLWTASTISFLAQVALWFATIVTFWLTHYERTRASDPAAATTFRLFRLAASVVIWTVTFVVALDTLGFDVRTLLTGLGIGGVAVALATQSILSDLFASLSIVIDKPFVVGDMIAVGDSQGTVESIGLKTTRVRSVGGEELIFANNELLKSRIRNLQRMVERRVLFTIGVVYKTDAATLEVIPDLLRRCATSQPRVRFDRAHLSLLGAVGYQFEVAYYVESCDYNVFMDTQQAVFFTIVKALSDAGVALAYPTQTLFVNQPVAAAEEARRSDVVTPAAAAVR